MVAVYRGFGQLGSLWVRPLDVDSALRLCLGLLRELGVSALFMRVLELLQRLWVGLVAGHGRMHAVVAPWRIRRLER